MIYLITLQKKDKASIFYTSLFLQLVLFVLH
jgi:hypothetical protein